MGLPKAEIVLRGGRVFQGLAEGFVSALAIWQGRVLATGSDEDMAPLIGPQTRVVELRGRAVVPGFNDAHQHLLPLGMALTEIDLRGERVTTLDELLRRVRERAAATPPGEWISGGRYDHFQLDIKRHPFREELDKAAPNHPVYLTRTCGHMGVANSMALARAGIDEAAPQPEGGHIEQQNGRLTGLLQERAQLLVRSIMPKLPLDRLIDGIEAGGKLLLSQGITSVMDAGVGLRQGFDDYLAYQEARRQRRLPVRVYLSITGGPVGAHETAREHGLVTGVGDDYLTVGSVKLFTDGSAGGKTAAMSAPYRCSCGAEGGTGIFLFRDDEIEAMVRLYHGRGCQISIHAIGDAAIGQALRAVALADTDSPVKGRRHRIEHCGFITPEQIALMQRLEMTLAPQPIFLYEFGDLYVDVLDEARPAASYPMRRWIDAGLHPAASSDAPVSSSNPMLNLYQMVTRKTRTGRVLGADERISLAEAIHCTTFNGAYGSFSETVKGRLVAGQLADFTVLDRDIFAIDPETLPEVVPDLTGVDGRIAFERPGAAA